jgi:hypothetical protein
MIYPALGYLHHSDMLTVAVINFPFSLSLIPFVRSNDEITYNLL